jgi:hypothetical protein
LFEDKDGDLILRKLDIVEIVRRLEQELSIKDLDYVIKR